MKAAKQIERAAHVKEMFLAADQCIANLKSEIVQLNHEYMVGLGLIAALTRDKESAVQWAARLESKTIELKREIRSLKQEIGQLKRRMNSGRKG